MSTSFSSRWLSKGRFDFEGQDPRATTTLAIKEILCRSLRLAEDGLNIVNYPRGPALKHTFWWREGRADYAEAQFVAAISNEHPVLSLGVSIEKGVDANDAARPEQTMDTSWDWHRLVRRLPEILSSNVPAIATERPVHLRVRLGVRVADDRRWWRTRAFSYVDEHWFERHGNRFPIEVASIVDYVNDEVERRHSLWAIVTLTQDLTEAEVEGMLPADAAAILLRFAEIRRRLRP